MKEPHPLLDHPFWEADPSQMQLVRFSREFPPELNPFAQDGVVIKAAGVPGEVPHSKWYVAREGILDGIRKECIGPDTTVIEATSGNTGDGMAAVCNALGIRFVAVMSGDVPQDKINAIRVLGRRTSVDLVFDDGETTVERARRLGAQEGYYNPDQYAGYWNPESHLRYLGPQVLGNRWVNEVSIIAAPAGTMGTCMGLQISVNKNNLSTKVVPVFCAEEQEVPGARTLSSVKKDIRQPWQSLFGLEDVEFGTRHAAFLLSFLTWPYVLQKLGPSFGLGFHGALKFLHRHKAAQTLDQFRSPVDGKIHVAVFGPDDCRPYISLYLGELNRKKELSGKTQPDLLRLLE